MRVDISLTLAWLVLASSAACPAQDTSGTYATFEPGSVVRLEGAYVVRQGAEESGGLAIEMVVSLDIFAAPGTRVDAAGDGSQQLIVVQTVAPRVQDPFSTSGTGVELATVSTRRSVGRSFGSDTMELAAQPGGMGLPVPLGGYARLDSVVPRFSFPAAGFERDLKGDLEVFGTLRKGSDLSLRVRPAGTKLSVSRRLRIPSGGLRVGESGPGAGERNVRAWREELQLETVAGERARHELVGLKREIEFTLERQGFRYEVSRSLDLVARNRRLLSASERAQLAKSWPAIAGFVAEFGKPGIDKKAWDGFRLLKEELGAPVFSPLVAALEARTEALYTKPRARLLGAPGARVAIGEAAPDFILADLDGEKLSFRRFTAGKVTLLTFWGYGCGPCRVEAPYLTRLLDKYAARGFAVVAVNAWGDPVEKVRSFVKRGGLKQKMLMDGRSVAKRQYAVLGFPTAYWIDHRGVVIAQEVGFRPESLPIMERRIEELLAAKKN